jgi:hypothetical protein
MMYVSSVNIIMAHGTITALNINILASANQSCNANTWHSGEVGKFGGIERPSCSGLFHTHQHLRLPTMDESSEHTKSLKPFQDILDSFEAEYRKPSSDDRASVIAEIVDDIRAAGGKKRVKLANDNILQKVSVYVLLSTYIDPELCSVVTANRQLVHQPPISSQR